MNKYLLNTSAYAEYTFWYADCFMNGHDEDGRNKKPDLDRIGNRDVACYLKDFYRRNRFKIDRYESEDWENG